ncbi:MAG: uroporphyrinogen-III synthase [Porticoccaceae bacterium]|nr:uroporphyrinogen-III synthase [Porticoccaceae bacterium]
MIKSPDKVFVMSLTGKKILIIRPKALPPLRPDRFIQQLSATGAQPLHLPVIRLQPYNVPQVDAPASEPLERIKSRVMALASYPVVIFVSRPAALLGADWIDHYWPQLPVATQFFAVGESTRQVLAQQGIDARVPTVEQTSEGLLALPELQQLQGRKVLIAKGEGGRELLVTELQQRGAQVDELNLYTRNPDNHCQQDIANALQSGLNAVVAHSTELLLALLNQLPKALHPSLFALPLVVPSERIAKLARHSGFASPTVASSALPDDMVSALSRCYISN